MPCNACVRMGCPRPKRRWRSPCRWDFTPRAGPVICWASTCWSPGADRSGCSPSWRRRRAGAAEIVATDLVPNALRHAAAAGADRTIDVAEIPDALDAYAADKGYFDVLYECTGTARALSGAIAAIRPRGVVIQVGLGGDMTVPMMQITVKELDLRGSFRFHEEFATAVKLMQSGLIDVNSVITHTIPLADAELAFRIAGDRSQTMKTQIAFD